MNALAMYGLLALTTAPPLLPNAALLAWAGVLAARGSLNLALVLAVVAASAVAGDLALHVIARRFGGPVRAWMDRRARRRLFLARTSLLIGRYGVPFVAGVRFLPAGRVAAALVTGIVRYPVRRYLLGCAIAETLWAAYSVGIGYLGIAATGAFLPGLALSVGLSAAVCGVTALAQHLVVRRLAGRSAEEADAAKGGEDQGDAGEELLIEPVDAAAAEAGTEEDGGQEDGVQQEDVRGEQAQAGAEGQLEGVHQEEEPRRRAEEAEHAEPGGEQVERHRRAARVGDHGREAGDETVEGGTGPSGTRGGVAAGGAVRTVPGASGASEAPMGTASRAPEGCGVEDGAAGAAGTGAPVRSRAAPEPATAAEPEVPPRAATVPAAAGRGGP